MMTLRVLDDFCARKLSMERNTGKWDETTIHKRAIPCWEMFC